MRRYEVIGPEGERFGFDYISEICKFITLDSEEVKRLRYKRAIVTKEGVEIFNNMNWGLYK